MKFVAQWLCLFSLLTGSALALTSCRKDTPPAISIICTLDGTGGGDCATADGTKVHKAPSELLNYWATTQTDEANFSGWCYKIPPAQSSAVLDDIRRDIMEGLFTKEMTARR